MDIWHLRLAFQSPVKHNLATHEGSDNIVVKITTGRGWTGYGEGIPRTFVTGETLDKSLVFLEETLIPALFRTSLASPRRLGEALAALRPLARAGQCPAALCALEMALLDAAGKTWGRSVSDLLGPAPKTQVVYSAVLPMAGTPQMIHFFRLVREKKMRFVKLKVGNASDLELLKMAREHLGWEIDIRVDANAAWSAAEAVARINEMEPYRISAVEQPVAKTDLAGLQQVSDAVAVPIIADESLCTEDDAQKLIDLKACRMFNIRLSKCGGLGNALRIREIAAKAGISCQLGCHVGETSILSAAGRHFALVAPELVYVEGSLSPYLLTRDPVAQPVVFAAGGKADPLPGPGLGVTVRDDLLDESAVTRVVLENRVTASEEG